MLVEHATHGTTRGTSAVIPSSGLNRISKEILGFKHIITQNVFHTKD